LPSAPCAIAVSALSKLATVAPASIDSIGAASAGDAVRTRVPARKQAGAQRSGQAAWSGPRAKPGGSSPSNRDAAAPPKEPVERNPEEQIADRIGEGEQATKDDELDRYAKDLSVDKRLVSPWRPSQAGSITRADKDEEPEGKENPAERDGDSGVPSQEQLVAYFDPKSGENERARCDQESSDDEAEGVAHDGQGMPKQVCRAYG
jgi:hypothetical protein